jgi:hypothetical protein
MASLTLADMAQRSVPGDRQVAKKHWIKGAIKHPGIEKKRAAQHGISTHEQLERDAKSSNPTLRRRGNLGLALTKHSKESRGDRWYGKKD